MVVGVWGCVAELFTRPYPFKVQTRPPRDQRLATQSKVSGWGGGGGGGVWEGKKVPFDILKQLRSMSERF